MRTLKQYKVRERNEKLRETKNTNSPILRSMCAVVLDLKTSGLSFLALNGTFPGPHCCLDIAVFQYMGFSVRSGFELMDSVLEKKRDGLEYLPAPFGSVILLGIF